MVPRPIKAARADLTKPPLSPPQVTGRFGVESAAFRKPQRDNRSDSVPVSVLLLSSSFFFAAAVAAAVLLFARCLFAIGAARYDACLAQLACSPSFIALSDLARLRAGYCKVPEPSPPGPMGAAVPERINGHHSQMRQPPPP